MQLSQDLKGHPETKDCIVSLPNRIKDGSTLTTTFATSFQYSKGAGEPQSLLLSLEIKEVLGGLPAVANANMLINLLCLMHEPFLSGTLEIKLDDVFATPIEVPVLLNLKETNGTAGIFFHIDEQSETVILTNGSSFDLNLSRGAFATPHSVSLIEISRPFSTGEALSLPLPVTTLDWMFVLILIY